MHAVLLAPEEQHSSHHQGLSIDFHLQMELLILTGAAGIPVCLT